MPRPLDGEGARTYRSPFVSENAAETLQQHALRSEREAGGPPDRHVRPDGVG